MKKQKIFKSMTRRNFLSGVAPACALTCLGFKNNLFGGTSRDVPFLQQTEHKFARPFDRKMNYRQFVAVRTRRFIEFAQFLEKELGKERLIALIKKHTLERSPETGKNLARRLGDNSLITFSQILKSPDTNIIMDIVEESETVFEMRVKECLQAETYLRQNAGDIGYAAVCFSDYSVIQAFNPKITLIRDKTLMEGHDYCNHRYVVSQAERQT